MRLMFVCNWVSSMSQTMDGHDGLRHLSVSTPEAFSLACKARKRTTCLCSLSVMEAPTLGS